MSYTRSVLIVGLVALAGALVWWWLRERPPDIPFATPQELSQADGGFDWLESRYPLTVGHRQTLTPENLERLDQAQIDQLYARLTAGPIPDGAYRGSFFFAEGGGPKRLTDLLGSLPGLVLNVKLDKLGELGQLLWKGKRFFKQEGVLRNLIEHEDLVADIFDVELPPASRQEVDGRQVGLLFPARLSCGKSLLDSRRPSIIIDYADNAEIPGYIEEIDSLVGRKGLNIRDEIRMIRPGLYLGRAYFDGRFGLTFVLSNEAVAASEGPEFAATGRIHEECAT